MAKISPGVGPRFPQVVVLFGATGDLARRKLLPGLFHLSSAGFIPGCRIIAVALDDIRRSTTFAGTRAKHSTVFVPQGRAVGLGRFCGQSRLSAAGGRRRLRSETAVEKAERALERECRRLHYLSVPPNAALVRGAHAQAKRVSSSARGSSWKSPSAPIWRVRCR